MLAIKPNRTARATILTVDEQAPAAPRGAAARTTAWIYCAGRPASRDLAALNCALPCTASV
jgi:hypothetical protein